MFDNKASISTTLIFIQRNTTMYQVYNSAQGASFLPVTTVNALNNKG